jgi:hypothetical protein
MKSKIQTPLNLFILWWTFWGLVSTLSFKALLLPSAQTCLILSIFIKSLFVGVLSIFMSQLEIMRTWTVLIFLIVLKTISKKINQYAN